MKAVLLVNGQGDVICRMAIPSEQALTDVYRMPRLQRFDVMASANEPIGNPEIEVIECSLVRTTDPDGMSGEWIYRVPDWAEQMIATR